MNIRPVHISPLLLRTFILLCKTTLIFILFIGVQTSALADKNKKWIKKGDKYFELGNYSKALDYYQNVNLKSVDNIRFMVRFGESFMYSGDHVKAAKFLRKAVEMNENPAPEHVLLLARALHQNLEYDDAIHYYEQWGKSGDNATMATKYVLEVRTAKSLVTNKTKALIKPLYNSVNSRYPDLKPKITASGERMYFVSRRINVADKKEADDGLPMPRIYSTTKRTEWNTVKDLPEPLNTEGFRNLTGISANGKMLFLYKEENGGDIYSSSWKKGKWTTPVALPEFINTSYHESSASLSSDGRTMYYIHGKEGNYDIYTATRDRKGNWSKPVALEILNSRFDEATPFIHADGKTLYFSSKGHNTMGGFDIFRTVKRSDGTWSKPENMGYPVNTPADETGFVLEANGKTGYYSAFRNEGKGYEDIYQIELEKSLANLTMYTGKVVDPNGKPVCATITVTDYTNNNELFEEVKCNCETGTFATTLPSGHLYGILVQADPYLCFSDNVLHDETAGFFEVDTLIKMREAATNETLILNNVHFERGSDEVTEAAQIELNKLAEFMLRNPDVRILVTAHTDNSLKPGVSLLLSQKRANNVSLYLKKQKVGASRIKARGFGDREPIASNKTQEGQRKNNRIEIRIQ